MKDMAAGDIRNFALLGHTGSGKTTLVDAMLFKLGCQRPARLHRRRLEHGRLDRGGEGPQDHDLGPSRSTACYKRHGGRKYGWSCSTRRATRISTARWWRPAAVADTALVVVDAVAGIQVGTNRAWRRCDELACRAPWSSAGLDRENADFDRPGQAIQAASGARAASRSTIPATGPRGWWTCWPRGAPTAMPPEVEAAKGTLIESGGRNRRQADREISGRRGPDRPTRSRPACAAPWPRQAGARYSPDGAQERRRRDRTAGRRRAPVPVAARSAASRTPRATRWTPAHGRAVRPASSGASVNDPFVGQLTLRARVRRHAEGRGRDVQRDQGAEGAHRAALLC